MTKRTQPVVLAQLIAALTQASGGASQLIHILRDPRMIIIRDAIDALKYRCIDLAPKSIIEVPKEKKRIIL